jgi:hypothetical protein
MSQKASDVIEDGIKVKSTDEIFLRFDGAKIKYQRRTAPDDLHFKTIKDSAILLPVDESLLIYIRPLNPLNFSFIGENKIIVDPIDEAAASSLKKITDFFMDPKLSQMVAMGEKAALNKAVRDTVFVADRFCAEMRAAVALYNEILDLLKDDKKQAINAAFDTLKKLDFASPVVTKDRIDKTERAIESVSSYYSDVQKKMKELTTTIEKVNCSDAVENFVVKRAFADATKDVDVTFSNQKKRLSNLEKVFKLIAATYDEAIKNNWLLPVDEVPADRGKISVFTFKVNESGYLLSDQGEIVEASTKEKATKLLRIRRFQRFVPEVSVGIAYTNLSFPKYSTATDATGKQQVVTAGEETINKINFTTMINYNLFLTNSPIHPFWQLGIGINNDFPTLLSGLGLRLNATGVKRIAISFGLATTWIKTLEKLKPGDVVTGPADVEKDTKYKFNNKPQTYFGVQYNF